MNDIIQSGIKAYRSGKNEEARRIFINAVKIIPNNELAWSWMYQTSVNDKERIDSLRQMVRINPDNKRARNLINQYIVKQPETEVVTGITTEWPRFARVLHWHERYKGPDGRGLSYIAYMRVREGIPDLHPFAGGDPAVFQLNQSAKDRAVYLTPELEYWMFGLDIESSQGTLPLSQVQKCYRNKLHGAKAFTNRTGWTNGCSSVILEENTGSEPQRMNLIIANGATVKVLGPKQRRGGKDVYPIEVLNAQDPKTLKRTLKDAWWLIFAATNSTIEPAPEGKVDPFPHLADFDVTIPLLANNTTVGYIEAGWIEFPKEKITAPVYPYYRSFLTEERWKKNRLIG
jgi:hypothetical protein